MNHNKKKVVITGAAGFIGSQLVRKLCEYSNYRVIPVSRRQVKNFVKVDSYENTPTGDIIIHLAESNLNNLNVDKSSILHEENNLLQLLSRNCDLFIYFSSGVVYGDSSVEIKTEHSKIDPKSEYAIQKLKHEVYVKSFTSTVVIRPSNVYGIGMSTSNVFHRILDQIHMEDSLILESLTPVRDFIHVSDVVSGVIRILQTFQESGKLSKTYNLSTGKESSILDLVKIALVATGQEKRKFLELNPTSTSSHLVLSNDLARKELNWTPKIDLFRGVSDLLRKTSGE